MKLEKEKTEFGYQFFIQTKEGTFCFYFAGNLDFYFTSQEEGAINSFTISDENYELYLIFDNLYKNIKTYNHFKSLGINSEDLKQLIKIEENNPKGLFKNEEVIWHCDELPYNEGCILKIKKEYDNYILTIDKRNNNSMSFANSVRIGNDGSRYDYAFINFSIFYNDLINYKYNNQISIDELLCKIKSKH